MQSASTYQTETPASWEDILRASGSGSDSAGDGATVGRFAPTPSGRMHLGNVFSCLMAWLGARSTGGYIVLRIEDLDPRAQSREASELLMDDLAWLGLNWDVGPFYQSERTTIYDAAIAHLKRQGLTYPCFCTRSELHAASAPHASDGTYVYQGTCRNLTPDQVTLKSRIRPPATRLRVPDEPDSVGSICFNDLVWGQRHEVLARECGDFLVRRSDGIAAYQLAVTVDDALMGVGQVVRGRDLLGSTARQIYLARLLGLRPPAHAHVPLLVAPDGRRLSKRDRDLDLGSIRASGVSPKRVVGLLASLVGLCKKGDDVMPQDLVNSFSWDALKRHHEDIVVNKELLNALK